jgi:lipoprotein-anchoring transpeptidase ErfK/SrfK
VPVTRAAVIAAACTTVLALVGCSSQRVVHRAIVVSAAPVAVTSFATPTPTITTPPPSPTPTPTPSPPNECAANTANQLILVSVSTQTAWMCSGATTVYTTPVTTGATADGYDDTPQGTFHVESRQTDRTLTLLSGAKYHVKYWIPFSGTLYGFHDATWQTMPFGSQDYHTLGSHGCVHLPSDAMAWLYSWVTVGATVTVRA